MSSRYVYCIAALLGLTALFACWCRAPLIWDGAYQFDMTLALQQPYVYLTRFHTWFLWWPTVWASRVTDNVLVLQAVYGLPFLLAPMAGVLLSWLMVRKHAPHLVVWAVFGIAAATLPGQIFVINDSIFQQHLFWPVFLGMLVPVSGARRIVRAVLIVFQLAHPLGVPLLFGGAVAVALVAIADRSNRRQLFFNAAMMGVMCAVAAMKIVTSNHIEKFHDTYAAHQASWEVARSEWQRGVQGAPLYGLMWIWSAGGLVLLQGLLNRRLSSQRRIIAMSVICCAAIGSAVWLYWAHDSTGESWMGAIDYRRWIGPLTAPFFLLATVEAMIAAKNRQQVEPFEASLESPQPDVLRGRVGIMLAATFALVLGMQALTWSRLTDRLMVEVVKHDSVVVPYSAPKVAWFRHTPLGHWGTGNYVSAMQGKTPAHIFLDPVCEQEFRGNPPELTYYAARPDAPPGPGGWFDFRPALRQLGAESSGGATRLPGGRVSGLSGHGYQEEILHQR